MPEQTPRTLNHFAFFKFKDAYFDLPSGERGELHAHWLAGLRDASGQVDVYQVYPAQTDADVGNHHVQGQ